MCIKVKLDNDDGHQLITCMSSFCRDIVWYKIFNKGEHHLQSLVALFVNNGGVVDNNNKLQKENLSWWSCELTETLVVRIVEI